MPRKPKEPASIHKPKKNVKRPRPGTRPDRRTTQVEVPPRNARQEIDITLTDHTSWSQAVTQAKKRAFLQEYAIQGTITHAARNAGISRSIAQVWLREDPEFRNEFKTAHEESVDYIEHSLRRRSTVGMDRKVVFDRKGKVVSRETIYSDVGAIFLLKGNRPEKYRERYEVTGAGGGPIEISDPAGRLVDKLDEIAARFVGASSTGAAAGALDEINRAGSGSPPK